MIAAQAALVAALKGAPAVADVVSGIFDGPPPRAAFPYVAISGGSVLDWSTKSETGRELRLVVNLWDDGEIPHRMMDLSEACCDAIEAMPRDLDGWRIASLVFVRSRSLKTAAGPWSGLIEYRARLLAA